MKTRLLANLNWLMVDKVIRLIGELFIGIWIARYLGPDQFGLLSYSLAFVALFSTLARLGINQIVVRDLVRSPSREGSILGTVFFLKLSSGILILPIVIIAAWFTQEKDLTFTILVAIIALGMIFNVFDAYDYYYQAHILSRYVVFARSTAFVLFCIVRVWLILGEYPVLYFAAAVTMELALGGVLLAFLYQRKHRANIRWHFDLGVMRSLLKSGWPLIISSALVVVHTRIDQVMIGQMLNSTEVGIYSAAIRLSESWLFIPLVIVQSLMPYFMKIREINQVHYHARLVQLYSIMFWLGTLAGITTFFLGEFIVVLLFGEQYRGAYMPLLLTIWTGIFISQAMARGIWLIGEDLQGYRLATNLIAVPMNIIINWLLIPVYGVTGAAAASLGSVGLSTWLVPFLFKPMRASNRQLLIAINPKYLFRGLK